MQLQYVGARYVPIWYENTNDGTANWQVNVEYEPLTWVTTTNNHLYLSKKTVPDNIGNPADNTDYWLDLGVFISGQYELLQQQIDDMKDGTVSGSLQNQILDINTDITDINSAIADIVKNLKGVSETYDTVFIGDSFGNDICTRLDEDCGFTVTYKNNQGGQGFKNDEFIGQLNDLIPTVEHPENVKYVIAVGGTNDTITSLDSTFKTKISDFCQRARTAFPNARILIGFCSTLYRMGDENRLKYKAFAKYSYERGCCEANVNAEFIDGLSECVANCHWLITDDRVHPNIYGYMNLAWVIYQAIKRQNITIPAPPIFNDYTVANTSEGISFSTQVSYVNPGHGSAILRLDPQTLASNATLDNSHVYVLLPISELPILPMRQHKQLVQIDASHSMWLDLSWSGLRVYGGGAANLSGTFSSFGITQSIEIPLSIY